MQHAVDQLDPVRLVERGPQCQQLVQGRPQGVHIAPRVGPAVEPLRRHVPQRAHDVAGARQLVAVLGLGQAEVGDPDFALGVEQEVGGLDVAVEDALLVSILEGLGDLDADPRHAAKILGLGLVGQLRSIAGWDESASSRQRPAQGRDGRRAGAPPIPLFPSRRPGIDRCKAPRARIGR